MHLSCLLIISAIPAIMAHFSGLVVHRTIGPLVVKLVKLLLLLPRLPGYSSWSLSLSTFLTSCVQSCLITVPPAG